MSVFVNFYILSRFLVAGLDLTEDLLRRSGLLYSFSLSRMVFSSGESERESCERRSEAPNAVRRKSVSFFKVPMTILLHFLYPLGVTKLEIRLTVLVT